MEQTYIPVYMEKLHVAEHMKKMNETEECKLYGVSREAMHYGDVSGTDIDCDALENEKVKEIRKRVAVRAGIRSPQIIDILLDMDDVAFTTLMMICQKKDERYSFLVDGVRLRDEHIRNKLAGLNPAVLPRESREFYKGMAVAYDDVVGDGLFEEFIRRSVDKQCVLI